MCHVTCTTRDLRPHPYGGPYTSSPKHPTRSCVPKVPPPSFCVCPCHELINHFADDLHSGLTPQQCRKVQKHRFHIHPGCTPSVSPIALRCFYKFGYSFFAFLITCPTLWQKVVKNYILTTLPGTQKLKLCYPN